MEDLIKRSDAIKALDVGFYKDEIELAIREIPSADRPSGEWIDGIKCSNCGQVDISRPNFCPMCGSRMKGADDDTD